MSRLPDWEPRLSAYLASVADKAYAFGRHDCLLFVAGAVRAVTGHDPGRGHRGKYSTEAGAVRYLKRLGFDSPSDLLDSMFERRTRAFAMRGDIALDREGIPGIVIGSEALMIGDGGVVRVPRSDWQRAWAV